MTASTAGDANGAVRGGAREQTAELDAQVAEQVMGLRRMRAGEHDWSGWTWLDGERAIPRPRYASDIATTWSVVGELNRRGFMVSIDVESDGSAAVSVLKETDSASCKWEAIATACADTVSVAICVAALTALASDPLTPEKQRSESHPEGTPE